LLNGVKQACAVLFPFLSFAYCSRIMGKDGLGIYAFAQSVVSYFVLIAALGVPNYAIREGAMIRDDADSLKRFIDQVFSINCVSMLLSYVLLFACVFAVPKLEQYRAVLFVLSAQLLLNTIGADWINTIIEDYLYLTIRYIVLQVVAFICLVLFVRSREDVIIYTIITVLSNAGGNLLNLIYLKRKGLLPRFTARMDLKRHLTPILVLFANAIAGVIYLSADVTMLGFYLNDAEVGVYTVSSKIYSLVKTLINAVIMVTIPRFSFYLGNGMQAEYRSKLDEVAQVLLVLLTPCIVGLTLEARKVIMFIAGQGYEAGIPVVRVLSVALLFAVYACFFSYSILVPHKQEVSFMIATVVAAVTNIALNLFFIPAMGILGAAITTLIAECVVVSMTVFYARKLALPRFEVKSVASTLAGGAVVAGICAGFNALGIDGLPGFVAEVLLCMAGYLLTLILLKNPQVTAMLQSVAARRGR